MEEGLSLAEDGTKTYALKENGTSSFTYDSVWVDKLAYFNGVAIIYDEIGNPTSYRGNNLTWSLGRRLASFGNILYTYNEEGIRTKKVTEDSITEFYLDDTNIIRQSDGTDTLYFFYDRDDNLLGFEYDDAIYYYVKNMQGDIVAISDESGDVVSEYSYDAWGKVLSVTGTDTALGTLNPFRYRGYYYDTDTNLYYLQSRYYDPETGRFINSDDVNFIGTTESEISYNPFAYCENDPVNAIDPTGKAMINAVCASIGAIAGWYFGAWIANRLGYYSGWKYWAIRSGIIVGGAVIGWFSGSLIVRYITMYLKANPSVIISMANTKSWFYSAMRFLGVNPFSLGLNSSKFMGLIKALNQKSIIISLSWAKQLYHKGLALGYRIKLDSPHGGYTWHIHVVGANRFKYHIQVSKSTWDVLKRLIG